MKLSFIAKVFLMLAIGVVSGGAITVIGAYINLFGSLEGIKITNEVALGGDFPLFYIAGKMLNANIASPYNLAEFVIAQRDFFTPHGVSSPDLIFVYPPHMLYIFGLLSKLEYKDAYFLYSAYSIIAVALSIYLILKDQSLSKIWYWPILIFLIGISFRPYSIYCLAGGQLSFIALIIWAGFYALYKSNREFLAGFILGLGFYKPPLFLFAGLLFLFQREWRVVSGALTSILIINILSFMLLGSSHFEEFINISSLYHYGGQLPDGRAFVHSRGVSLLSIIMSILGYSSKIGWYIWAALTIALLIFSSKEFRIRDIKDSTIAFASLVSISTLLSLQLGVYDLTIFLIPILALILVSLEAKNEERNKWVIILSLILILTVFPMSDTSSLINLTRLVILFCCALLMLFLSLTALKNKEG